jgi:hypothetical protein
MYRFPASTSSINGRQGTAEPIHGRLPSKRWRSDVLAQAALTVTNEQTTPQPSTGLQGMDFPMNLPKLYFQLANQGLYWPAKRVSAGLPVTVCFHKAGDLLFLWVKTTWYRHEESLVRVARYTVIKRHSFDEKPIFLFPNGLRGYNWAWLLANGRLLARKATSSNSNGSGNYQVWAIARASDEVNHRHKTRYL